MDFLGFCFLKTSFVFITFYDTYAELNSHMPFTQSVQFHIAFNFEGYFFWGWNSRFSTFKISLHSLISVAKSVISLPVAPLQVMCLFSSVTFKIFIFVFGFYNLTMMYLRVISLSFRRIVNLLNLLVDVLPQFWKFLTSHYSNNFFQSILSLPFSRILPNLFSMFHMCILQSFLCFPSLFLPVLQSV